MQTISRLFTFFLLSNSIAMDNTIKSITFNAYLPKFLLFGDSITQYAYSYDKGKTFVLGAQLSDSKYWGGIKKRQC